MNVLFVSTFPPRRCGIGDYTADLAFAMSNLGGLRLRVLTYSDGVDAKFSQERGVEISRTLGQHPAEAVLAAEIEGFAPDLVHVQSSSFLHPSMVNRLIVRSCPAPMVTTVHDTPRSWRIFYAIPSLRGLYRKSRRLIVHSPSVRSTLKEFHGVDDSRIVRMPHGVDVEKYSPNAPTGEARARYALDHQRFILFFGFLRPGKGVETLLQAWQIIENSVPDTLLIVAGGVPSSSRTYFFNLLQEGDYPDKLVHQAKSLRLERRVRFTGYVPDELVPGLFASADAIVLPYEGSFSQSGPLHKALSSGRPLIASDVSGSTELLEHEKTALLSPAGDARSLAKAIRRVLIDRQLAERLAQNGRRMAEERLDWGILARSSLHVYSNAVEAG